MRKKEGKKSPYILSLLALAAFVLSLQLGTVATLAQQDTDKDGFAETGTITFPAGLSLAAYPNVTSLPLCSQAPQGTPRDQCVDPATKDLFVIIQRASGCPASIPCGDSCSPTYGTSDIPMPPYTNTYNPLELLSRLATGFTTHELIQASGYTSQAIGDYYAVKVIEDLNPCSQWMGFSTFGAFDGTYTYTGGVATVWPEKIKNWIRQACSVACFVDRNNVQTCYTPATTSGTFTCKNPVSGTTVNMKSPNPDFGKLNGEFIQNIINHEVSHMIHLASAIITVDHHYAIDQGVLMEQYINPKATKDRNNNITVNLNISTGYTADDKSQTPDKTGVYRGFLLTTPY